MDRRRGRVVLVALFLMLGALAPAGAGRGSAPCPRPDRAKPTVTLCRFSVKHVLNVTEEGGLGRVEVAGKVGAVLQRDAGVVTLLDLKDAARPKKLGSYDDDAKDSLDGDLAFSDDGKWLFYARQTRQFSKDGLHVLDVSNPSTPRLSTYSAAGGAYRVDYYRDGDEEWVVMLDATHGLVVYRFEPTTGQVTPVFVDPAPALRRVGGPASAGIFIDREDPALGIPLLYVSSGTVGLQVYDLSDPTAPALLGSWSEVGLAEIEVAASKTSRRIYAATEYWFDKQLVPEVVVLDASNLEKIRETRRFSYDAAADDSERIQGMALADGILYIAHSRVGVLAVDRRGDIRASVTFMGAPNEGAGVPPSSSPAASYVIDVEARGGVVYATDAATGLLTSLKPLLNSN